MTDTNQDPIYETRAFDYGKRFVRRVSDGALRRPFGAYGFFPALLLGAVALFSVTTCAAHIESETRKAAEAALLDKGLSWVTVDVSGQNVTLKGVPPSDYEGKQAIDVVTNQLAGTPLWRAKPAELVRADFSGEAPGPSAATQPVTAPIAAAGLNDWTFRVSNGEMFLEGSVPDANTRQRILDIGKQAVNSGQIRRVQDDLTITGRAEPEGYLAVALRGASIVTRCDRAKSQFIAQRFSLYCEVPRAAEASVRSDAASALQFGTLGDINILTNESVSDCETALAALLTGSSIEFETGLADISGASLAQLNRIATAAAACPGTLRIEGHTDNTGSSAINDSLSQRRAAAVRDALIQRGVPASRLVAQGFGAREPKASNASASGRALNRRIEIEVVREPG